MNCVSVADTARGSGVGRELMAVAHATGCQLDEVASLVTRLQSLRQQIQQSSPRVA